MNETLPPDDFDQVPPANPGDYDQSQPQGQQRGGGRQQGQARQQAPNPEQQSAIGARKKLVVTTLFTKFNEPVWLERLVRIAKGDESKVMKALNSFSTYIMNDDGGGNSKRVKVYICTCTLSSICAAFLESFQLGIEVGGGRDHAYLINYSDQCELEISYKGFAYFLNQHFDNAFVIAECVFEGDKFTSSVTDSTATYTHEPADAFAKTWDKMKGVYCYFAYTLRENGKQVSRLVTIPRGTKDPLQPDTIEMIRSKAKGSFAWTDFPFEQSKKSVLRRAAKVPIAMIDFDEAIGPEEVDNRHYELEKGTSGDRLKLLIEKQSEIYDEEKPNAPNSDVSNDKGSPVENRVAAKDGSKMPADGAGHTVQGETHDKAGAAPAADNAAANPADADQTLEGGAAKSAAAAQSQNTGQPAVADTAADSSEGAGPRSISDADFEEVPAGDGRVAPVWDGKTIILNGKPTKHNFDNPAGAAAYLKKVVGARKHKASRLKIIEDNTLIVAALIKAGNGGVVAELHKLASEGV